MNNHICKIIFKCLCWSVFTLSMLLVSAYFISISGEYPIENTVFIEGLLFIMIGSFASISGNPSGLFFQTTEQNNFQYKALETLRVNELEKEKTKNVDTLKIISSVGTISLIISGIIGAIISFYI